MAHRAPHEAVLVAVRAAEHLRESDQPGLANTIQRLTASDLRTDLLYIVQRSVSRSVRRDRYREIDTEKPVRRDRYREIGTEGWVQEIVGTEIGTEGWVLEIVGTREIGCTDLYTDPFVPISLYQSLCTDLYTDLYTDLSVPISPYRSLFRSRY
eukprot:9255618-Pyramimonas_sp.AAC.1